jgi:hypothetical protein
LQDLFGDMFSLTGPGLCDNLPFVVAIRIFLFRRQAMATKSNFILKVQDAKLADVQKALKDANINVVSILEVHKEEA